MADEQKDIESLIKANTIKYSEDKSDPKHIIKNGKALFERTNKIGTDQAGTIIDRDWLKNSFLLTNTTFLENVDASNRFWSSADNKFTDSSIGGNIGINARPQFTRYSDIRSKGKLSGRKNVSPTGGFGNIGMGRYYSEAIDDPSQVLYLRFGVPQFNSLTNFLAKAFNNEEVSIARTGRGRSMLYKTAKAATTIVRYVTFPAISIGLFFLSTGLSMITKPSSKFYTLKPTMDVYWNTVQNLVMAISVNRGILPKTSLVFTKSAAKDNIQTQGSPFQIDKPYLDELSKIMPDFISKEYFIDVANIASRAARIANQTDMKEYIKKENGGGSFLSNIFTSGSSEKVYDEGGTGTAGRLQKMLSLDSYINDTKEQVTEIDPTVNLENTTDPTAPKEESSFTKFTQYLNAEMRDGTQFAIFRVEHTGSVSESFGNSSVESDIAQKINGASSQIRDLKFSMANGNIASGIISEIGTGIKDIIEGGLSGLTAGFSDLLFGLAGSGFLDVPKHWQSSTASLPRSSYTMQLISPYGNAISQMQNLYLPLAMILAGTLPLSTGKQSYTSPFICQLFDRGRCQIQLGMIESLSINRGTSNLPFNLTGNALSLEVTFTVADLSTIMHMPVGDGLLGDVEAGLDQDNILSQYLAVLAGQSIYNQIYALPKLHLRESMEMLRASRITSPAWIARTVHESSITKPVFSVIETFQPGSRIVTR